MEKTKKCSKCNRVLPLIFFKHGDQCNDCKKEYLKEYYQRNRNKCLKYAKRVRKLKPKKENNIRKKYTNIKYNHKNLSKIQKEILSTTMNNLNHTIDNLDIISRFLYLEILKIINILGIFRLNSNQLKKKILSIKHIQPIANFDIEDYIKNLESKSLIYCYRLQDIRKRYGIILGMIDSKDHKFITSRYPMPNILNKEYRDAIYRRDNCFCIYTKIKLDHISQDTIHRLSIDKIIPEKKEGNTLPYNLITASLYCTVSRKRWDPVNYLKYNEKVLNIKEKYSGLSRE